MNLYLNADCMNPETGLPSYPDNYFDLAIVDPPYGIDIAKEKPRKSGRWDYGDGGQKNWDASAPNEAYFQELRRVSRHQIVWGGNYFANFLPPSRCWIVWDKLQPVDNFADCELAYTSFDRVANTFRLSFSANKGKQHPTQKPMSLYRWLVKNYAKQGDKILDTHVGSASSLVVYEEMGFEYVGFELDKDYYRDSCKRLEAFRAQPKLFTGKELFEASKPPTLF